MKPADRLLVSCPGSFDGTTRKEKWRDARVNSLSILGPFYELLSYGRLRAEDATSAFPSREH